MNIFFSANNNNNNKRNVVILNKDVINKIKNRNAKEKKHVNKQNVRPVNNEQNEDNKIYNYFKATPQYDINEYEIYNNRDVVNLYSAIDTSQILFTKTTCIREFTPRYEINSLDDFDNFILIVDFPNLGGGTTFFLNYIVSYYKRFVNFLIVRKIDNNYVFNINEEYELSTKFNLYNGIRFLNANSSKVIKIFVNHSIKTDIEFINNLFTLQKEVTTISHDYYLFFSKYNPSYKEIMFSNIKENDMNDMNVNLYDKIITQNPTNLNILEPIVHDKKKIVVAELPDFFRSETRIETNNKYLVVGIIGAIADIKGATLIKNIVNHYNNNHNIKFVIFGKINEFTSNNLICHEYSSIDEFNSLLMVYRPNLLLETSVWPETYSYTLTMCMLTQLPIIYFKKPVNSVVENRLSTYKKAISFNTVGDLDDIFHSNKQFFFYTIKNVVYFNTFWDNYFSMNRTKLIISQNLNYKINIKNKNIVIITSKIYVSDKKFSYVNKRSIYSTGVRFQQTLQTINSIRQHVPDSYIILFDNSKFVDQRMKNTLENSVNYFMNIVNDENLNYYTDEYEYKAFAEISQLLKICTGLLNNVNLTECKQIFKISGRYILNSQFNYDIYNNENNIIKKNMNITDRNYWYTCFYKINKYFFRPYFDRLQMVFKNKEKYLNDDLEVIFSKIFSNDFQLVNTLGVTQNIAVWHERNNI